MIDEEKAVQDALIALRALSADEHDQRANLLHILAAIVTQHLANWVNPAGHSGCRDDETVMSLWYEVERTTRFYPRDHTYPVLKLDEAGEALAAGDVERARRILEETSATLHRKGA